MTPIFPFTGPSVPLGSARLKPIFPEEGLKIGPVQIHPFLGISEVFTDNAFRTNSARETDFITVIAPGIQARLPFGEQHQFVAHYNATRLFYVRFPGNDALVQDAWGRFNLNFPGGVAIDLQGGHTEGFIPRGNELDIQQPEISKWNTNTFFGQAEYFTNLIGTRLRVRSTRWNFVNNGLGPTLDRLTNAASVTFFGAVTPKTFLLLNLGLLDQIYDQNKQLDSLSLIVTTGIRVRATAKTTGEIRFGYQVLNFDRAPLATSPGPGLSVGGNKQEIFRVFGRFNWQPWSRLLINVQPFRTIQQAAVFDSSVFTQTGVALGAKQTIGTRTFLNGNFRFSSDDFDSPVTVNGVTESRQDTRFTLGGGLEYRTIKWLGLRMDYFFQQRSSTVEQFGFFANTIMLSIQGFI